MAERESLPGPYASLTGEELDRRIRAAKTSLGPRAVILGHHYQQDAVIRHADLTGDSLKLSQLAGEQRQAEFIVFCGVHFMAESADILSGAAQAVILPDPSAGCPMADMAEADDVQTALEELTRLAWGTNVVPVTYVNSSADVKAVTGRAGGACCTSSNSRAVMEWALGPSAGPSARTAGGGRKVLAVPDQHLACATALDMGYGLEDCVLYRPSLPDGGLSAEQVARATFILWAGGCHVHQGFTVEHVRQARRQYPGIRVIVHPECDIAVVRSADLHGSTEQIVRAVADSPPTSQWAVGTEGNLVARLARQFPDRRVVHLGAHARLCPNMLRINPGRLCWALENLVAGRIVNRVHVADDIRRNALVALERMISLKGAAAASSTRPAAG